MFKSRDGYTPDSPVAGEIIYSADLSAMSDTLPSKVDLRKDMPRVFNQGIFNSCVQNTIVAVYALCAKREGVKKALLSRMSLYFFARIAAGHTAWQNQGTSYRQTLQILTDKGTPSAKYWPYFFGLFPFKPFGVAEQKAKDNLAVEWMPCDLDEATVKASLASGYPVMIGFRIPATLESFKVRLTGDLPMPSPMDNFTGSHASAIVGYDDSTNKYLIRNSWGFWWGLKNWGHFTVPYAFVSGPTAWAGEGWILRTVQ